MNYRTQLEKESAELASMLRHAEPTERARGVRRLREIATELDTLDHGEHWTQAGSDTLARIVVRDIGDTRKTISR